MEKLEKGLIMKPLWMVYTDPYTDGYGSEIYLAGVFESESEAVKCANDAFT